MSSRQFIAIILLALFLAPWIIGYIIFASKTGFIKTTKRFLQALLPFAITATIIIGALQLIPPEQHDTFWTLLYLLFTFICWAVIILILWRRRQARLHNLFMELGNDEALWVVLISVLLIMSGLYRTYDGIFQNTLNSKRMVEAILEISFGLCSLLFGLSKASITEEGLTWGVRFIHWQNIESYRWEYIKSDFDLELKLAGVFWMNKIRFDIPDHQRQAVETILNQHVTRRPVIPQGIGV